MRSILATSLLFLTSLSALTFADASLAQVARQWGYPPGSCPPNQSTADTEYPASTPEAHYFPSRPAADGRPAIHYSLTLTRRPCAASLGTSELRLRFGLPAGASDWRPRLTVIQDGIEHGCTGVNWSDTTTLIYPGECTGANGLFRPAPRYGLCFMDAFCARSEEEYFTWMTKLTSSAAASPYSSGTPLSFATRISTVTLSIQSLQTSFDPDRAFTLRLRGNWPFGAPDALYEIPALGTPGNVARIPERVSGMWWNPAEPGTALIIDRNERGAVFAAWLTYGDQGESTWYFMSNGTPGEPGEVSGVAYASRGEPFSMPGTNLAFAAEVAGRFSLRFADASHVEFRWALNGRSGVQHLQRFEVRVRDFTCQGDRHVLQVPGLPGWGAYLEGNTSDPCSQHATLLTYDDQGRAMWVFGGLAGVRRAPGAAARSYGELFRPTGTPYAMPYDPRRFNTGAALGTWEATPNGAQIRLGSKTRTLMLERFYFEY